MRFLFPVIVFLIVAACDSAPGKTQEQIQAEIAASQEEFARERERIEREHRAREAQLIEQRSYVSARLVSVDAEKLIVELSNETDRDIDNLVGSLEVLDSEGNHVTGIALTNWVPGDIYLPAGATARARKNLDLESPERQEQIIDGAESYRYLYTTHRIQFVGDDEINYLQPMTQPSPSQTTDPEQEIVEVEPVNQASPEPCADTQITLETNEEYYPGPKCEHIGRNIDSERFKVEYIDMCKTALGISGHLPSVARVQVSSCMEAPGGEGIVYRKRICCAQP
ncbi:MAG: hypothetical protein KJO32_18720 [Deltaproteobacteria bacterium]|nr:hypothetical protein [Deltaproteobacteria bacterium]